MRGKMWHKGAIFVLLMLLATARGSGLRPAQAQGNFLRYGDSVAGNITPETPLTLYSFSGEVGDRVQIDVIGLEGTLEPAMDLLTPDRETLVSSRPDRLATDARNGHITHILPVSGVYSLMVGGANGTTGNFLLQLAGQTVPSTALPFGQAMSVTFVADDAPQHYHFVAESCPTMLSIVSPSAGETVTLPFAVAVTDERGQHVAFLRGGEALDDRVTVAPFSGTYEVTAWIADPALAGSYTLLVSCAGEGPACLSNDGTLASNVASEACPECPSCRTSEGVGCADFAITASAEGTEIAFTWSSVEGAYAYVWSLLDEEHNLLGARMLELSMGTSDTVNVAAWGMGHYTIHMDVWFEDDETVCSTETVVEVGDMGPVDWGEPAGEECSIRLVSPRDAIANGPQTFYWDPVPGAESYRVHISDSSDSLIISAEVAGHATSVMVNTSEDVIGPGHEFYIRVFALRSGEFWCSDGAIVSRP